MVEKKSSDDAKHSALGEIIIPLFGVLFTAYYFSTILDSPWTAQVNAVLVGSILLIISAIFFFRIFSSYKKGHSVFVFQYQQILSAIRSRQAVFIFITLGYLLLVEFIGYTFATVVLVRPVVFSIPNWARSLKLIRWMLRQNLSLISHQSK